MISALDDLADGGDARVQQVRQRQGLVGVADLRAALVACGASPLPKQSDDEPLDK